MVNWASRNSIETSVLLWSFVRLLLNFQSLPVLWLVFLPDDVIESTSILSSPSSWAGTCGWWPRWSDASWSIVCWLTLFRLVIRKLLIGVGDLGSSMGENWFASLAIDLFLGIDSGSIVVLLELCDIDALSINDATFCNWIKSPLWGYSVSKYFLPMNEPSFLPMLASKSTPANIPGFASTGPTYFSWPLPKLGICMKHPIFLWYLSIVFHTRTQPATA